MNPVQPSQSASVRPAYYQELDQLVRKYQGKEISQFNPQTLTTDYQKLVTAVQKLAKTELTTIEDKTTATDCWRVGNQIRDTFNSKNIIEYKVPVLGFLSAFFSQAWSKGLKCAAKETTYVKVDSLDVFQKTEKKYDEFFKGAFDQLGINPGPVQLKDRSISQIRAEVAPRLQILQNTQKLEQINNKVKELEQKVNEFEEKINDFSVPDPKAAQALLQKYDFATDGDELVFVCSERYGFKYYPKVYPLGGEKEEPKWLSDIQVKKEQNPKATNSVAEKLEAVQILAQKLEDYHEGIQRIQKWHKIYQGAEKIETRRSEFDESAFLNGVTSFGTPSSLPCFCYQKTEDNARLKLILMQDQNTTHNIEVDLRTKPGQIILKTQPEQVFHTFAGFKEFVDKNYNIDLDTKNSLPVRDEAQTRAINDCVKKCASEAISVQEFEKNIELCKSLEIKNKTLSQIVQDGAGLFLYTVSFDAQGKPTQKNEELHPEYKNSSASMYRNQEKFEGIQGDSLQKFAVESNKKREIEVNKKLDELRESTSANNVDKSEIETFVGKVNTTLGSQKLLPDQFFSFHISEKPYNLFFTKVWGDTTPNVTVSTWNDTKKTYEPKTYPITCPKPGVFVLDGTEFSSIQEIKKYCSDNFGMTKVDFEKKFTKVQANLEAIQKDTLHTSQKEPQVQQALESFSSVPAVHKEKTWVFHSSSLKEAPHLYAYKNGHKVKIPVICTENGYQVGEDMYPTFKQLISELNETYGPCLPVLQSLQKTVQSLSQAIETIHLTPTSEDRASSKVIIYNEKIRIGNENDENSLSTVANTIDDTVVVMGKKENGELPRYEILQADPQKPLKRINVEVKLVAPSVGKESFTCQLHVYEGKASNVTAQFSTQEDVRSSFSSVQQKLRTILPSKDSAKSYEQALQEAGRKPKAEQEKAFEYEELDLKPEKNRLAVTPSFTLTSQNGATLLNNVKDPTKAAQICLAALEQTLEKYPSQKGYGLLATDIEKGFGALLESTEEIIAEDFELDSISPNPDLQKICSRVRYLSDDIVRKNDPKLAAFLCQYAKNCMLPQGVFSQKFVEKYATVYQKEYIGE